MRKYETGPNVRNRALRNIKTKEKKRNSIRKSEFTGGIPVPTRGDAQALPAATLMAPHGTHAALPGSSGLHWGKPQRPDHPARVRKEGAEPGGAGARPTSTATHTPLISRPTARSVPHAPAPSLLHVPGIHHLHTSFLSQRCPLTSEAKKRGGTATSSEAGLRLAVLNLPTRHSHRAPEQRAQNSHLHRAADRPASCSQLVSPALKTVRAAVGTMSKQLSMASRLLDVKEQHFQISLIRLIHQFFFSSPLYEQSDPRRF